MNFKLTAHVVLISFALFPFNPAQANPEKPGLACLELPEVENSWDKQPFDAMLQVHNEAVKVGNTDLAFRSGCHSYFLGIDTSGVSKQTLANLAVAVARLQYERFEDDSSLDWHVKALSHERRANGQYNASAFRPLVQAAYLAIWLRDFERAAEYVKALSKVVKRGFSEPGVERAEFLTLKGQFHLVQASDRQYGFTRDLQVSSARKSFSRAVEDYTNLNLSIEAADVLIEIGEVEALTGNLAESMKTFSRAGDAFVTGGLSEGDVRMIRARSGILQTYRQMGQNEKIEALRDEIWEHYGGTKTSARRRAKTVAPAYPLWPASRGIEGWVLVGFEISESGRVVNPVAIDSYPSFAFNKTAINALRQWKYEPIPEAETDAATNARTQVVLTFKLED